MGKKYAQELKRNLISSRRRKFRATSDIGLENPVSRFTIMMVSLRESSDPVEKEHLDYFDKAGLNPDDPFHWKELLQRFASVHTRKSNAGLRKWTAPFCKKLKIDAIEIGMAEGTKSVTKIAALLHERDPRYKLGGKQNFYTQMSRHGLVNPIKQALL